MNHKLKVEIPLNEATSITETTESDSLYWLKQSGYKAVDEVVKKFESLLIEKVKEDLPDKEKVENMPNLDYLKELSKMGQDALVKYRADKPGERNCWGKHEDPFRDVSDASDLKFARTCEGIIPNLYFQVHLLCIELEKKGFKLGE